MKLRAAFICAVCAICLQGAAQEAQVHAARGVVVRVSKSHRSVVISCDAIAGYMDAMEMSFAVSNPKKLAAITPGTTVRFTIAASSGGQLEAENIEATTSANLEPEPMEAGGLTALNNALNPASASRVLVQGQSVPDFVLIDQVGRQIHLADFLGKVVVLTFGYSRCPNPAYCLRLSNNLARVEARFSSRAGRELVLLTVAIDPEHDRGKVLQEYAAVFKADPERWHFLTGPLSDVQQVAGMFGMNFWPEEGLLTHSLHTVIIDRRGRLAANLEGNQFTARQLGDLAKAVMDGGK